MPTLLHDGLAFHYQESGTGTPIVLQHGLGGDVNQPFGVFSPPDGFRLLSFDCRAHGQTVPLGDETKISIASFADDLIALLEALRVQRLIIGGISMGAAVALNFAIRYPQRVLGLILSRPAWLDGPMPNNARIYALIAKLIREHGAQRGRELFEQSPDYQNMLLQSPDCAASLSGQFCHPRAEETVVKLERIPRDAPTKSLADLREIRVPTLVLANRQDPIHPFEYGEALAHMIAGAELYELTPKSVSSAAHAADVQRSISDFLQRRFGT